MTLLILYSLLTITASFLCSVLEAILLSASPHYIDTLTKSHPRFAQLARRVKGNLDQSIASILVVNTFAHTLGAAAIGAQSVRVFGDHWQALVAIVLTLGILYLSEILPKVLGATYWKQLLRPAVTTIYFLTKIAYPFVVLGSLLTRFIKSREPAGVSREEIVAIAEMGEKQGSLLSQESDLIENLLSLKGHRASDILTPRSVVFALAADTRVRDALEIDLMHLHSRIPLFEDTIDSVTGLVFNQKILEASLNGEDDKPLRDIAVPVFMVSENLPVLNLLDLFIKRQEHLFVVHDRYGQTAGVVTLEDAIETLLGVEIVDEMDRVVDMQAYAKERGRIMRARLARQAANRIESAPPED